MSIVIHVSKHKNEHMPNDYISINNANIFETLSNEQSVLSENSEYFISKEELMSSFDSLNLSNISDITESERLDSLI